MTTIAHSTVTAEASVLDGVVDALAAQGIVVASVTPLFDGRVWSVDVHHHAPGLTDTDVRVAVWNTVANYTAILGVAGPAEGVRVLVGR